MLAFFTGFSARTYAIAALVALGMVLIAGVYRAGYNSASRQCDAAALRAELATVRADLANAKTAEADAAKRAGDLETSSKKNQEALDALIAFRAKGGVSASCHLDDATARRLQSIR